MGWLDRYQADVESAGKAAQERVTACRQRLEELHSSDVGAHPESASRARERLQAAEERARVAAARLRTIQGLHVLNDVLRSTLRGTPDVTLPPMLDLAAPQEGLSRELGRWATAARPADIHGLWVEFVAYGGDSGRTELDAYLHGLWSMSERDRLVLEQVWWERRQGTAPDD